MRTGSGAGSTREPGEEENRKSPSSSYSAPKVKLGHCHLQLSGLRYTYKHFFHLPLPTVNSLSSEVNKL